MAWNFNPKNRPYTDVYNDVAQIVLDGVREYLHGKEPEKVDFDELFSHAKIKVQTITFGAFDDGRIINREIGAYEPGPREMALNTLIQTVAHSELKDRQKAHADLKQTIRAFVEDAKETTDPNAYADMAIAKIIELTGGGSMTENSGLCGGSARRGRPAPVLARQAMDRAERKEGVQ